MISNSRAQLGSIVSFVADASVTLLSERVHRGSLANARSAMDERMAADLGSQDVIREWEARGQVRRLPLTGTSG